jgi:hypothetical protein
MTSTTAKHAASSAGKWSIAVDPVWFPCFGSTPKLHVHSSEQEARIAFKMLRGPRILINDSGAEVLAAASAPWKKLALRSIRQELKRNSFCLRNEEDFVDFDVGLPHLSAGKQKIKDLCDLSHLTDFEFSGNDAFLSDDLASPAVELPKKKRLLSDTLSTAADLESSRTTRSVFSITSSSPVDVCQSTSSSVYKLLGLGSKRGSVDICQSTQSTLLDRLLDLDSRQGLIFIED